MPREATPTEFDRIGLPNRFEVEREVGRSAMSVVLRARDTTTSAAVALKFPALFDTPSTERVRREAEVLRAVAGEGVPRVVAASEMPDGRAWIATEWIDGPTLGQFVQPRGLDASAAVDVVRQIARVLERVHAAGYVHCDLTANNVVLDASRKVTLIDFGAAQSIRARRRQRAPSETGTPAYLSPHRARGAPARAVDDLWAVGCLLFEALTGRRAFEGDRAVDVLSKILFEPPPNPAAIRSDVPAALRSLVEDLLAQGQGRVRTATSIRRRLERAATSPTGVEPPGPTPRARPRPRPPARHECTVYAARADAVAAKETADLSPGSDTGAAHREIVRRALGEGGRVEQLAGGALVARFAQARSPHDDARAAARFAAWLRTRNAVGASAIVASLSSHPGDGFAADVRRAASLAARVPRGAVALDESVARWISSEFETDAHASGLALLRAAKSSEGPHVTRAEAASIGRGGEVAAILRAITELREAGRAAPSAGLRIVGSTGIGKSAVLREARRRLLADHRATFVVQVAGRWPTRASPWNVVRDVSVGIASIHTARACSEPDVDRVVRAAIAWLVSPPNRRRRFAAMLPSEPRARAFVIRHAFYALVKWRSAHAPVVILIDDAQWLDAASREIFSSLQRSVPGVAIVACVRVDAVADLADDAPWSGTDTINLAPLDRRASARLVRKRLGAKSPASTVRTIVARAGGNPLYLEELARAWRAGVRHDVPDTVRGVIGARLMALSASMRSILQCASVFGSPFVIDDLAAMVARAPVDHAVATHRVRRTCRDLARRELLTRQPDGALAFTHALLEDASYATIDPGARRILHERAGELLRGRAAPDAFRVAQHFHRAGRMADARSWYLRATHAAFDANDLPGVVPLVRAGLECGARGVEYGELRMLESQALNVMGHFDEALVRAEEAAAALPGTSRAWFRAVTTAATTTARLGRIDRTIDWLHRARAARASEGALDMKVRALARGATFLTIAGRRSESERLLRSAESASKRRGLHDAMVTAALAEARYTACLHSGAWVDAVRHIERAAQAYRRAHDVPNIANADLNHGYVLGKLGLFDEATRKLERALAIAEREHVTAIVPWALSNLGNVLSELERYDEADDALSRALSLAQTTGDRRLEASCRIYGASALLARRQFERAEHAAGVAATVAEDHKGYHAHACAIRAIAALHRGDLDGARAAGQACERDAQSGVDMEDGQATIALAMAHVALADGDTDRARAWVERGWADVEARFAAVGDDATRSRQLHAVRDQRWLGELRRQLDAASISDRPLVGHRV